MIHNSLITSNIQKQGAAQHAVVSLPAAAPPLRLWGKAGLWLYAAGGMFRQCGVVAGVPYPGISVPAKMLLWLVRGRYGKCVVPADECHRWMAGGYGERN